MHWNRTAGIVLGSIIALFLAVIIFLWSYDFNRLRPDIEKWIRDASGRALTINGKIDLRLGFNPSLVVKNVTFQNAPWGTRTEMAKMAELEVRVVLLPLLTGRFEVKNLTLVKPDILIETDKQGRSNFDMGSSKSPQKTEEKAKGAIPFLEFESLRLVDGNVAYRNGRSGARYALKIEDLTLTAEAFGTPSKIRFKGMYLDVPLEISGTIGRFAGILDPSVAWPLDLKATAFGSDFTVAGQIKDLTRLKGVDLKISVQGADLTGLQQTKGALTRGKGAYRASGRITNTGPKQWRFSEFKLTGNHSKVSGLLNLNLTGRKPQFKAELISQRLDLRPFITSGAQSVRTEKKPAMAKDRKDKVFPATSLGLNRLNGVDGTANIRIEKLLLPHLALDQVRTTVVLAAGRLQVKPLKARTGGGDFEVDFEINAKGKTPALAAKLKATHLRLGSMLKELGFRRPMEGIVDLELDVTGHGNSVAAWMASLNGVFVIDMSDARILSTHMDLLGADLGSELLHLLNPVKSADEYTTINCLVSEFNIRDGLAKSNVLFVDTPAMTAAAFGQVNLKTEHLSFGVKTKPKKGIGTKETGELTLSLSEFARPIQLTGTLAHPSLGISTTEAALTIAKAAGSTALFGPIGLAALFVSGDFGDKDSCATARKAVGQAAIKEAAGKSDDQKSSVQEGVNGFLDKLKGLFGK